LEASPESALLRAKVRCANNKPVVDKHSDFPHILRNCDPKGARAAMRSHVSSVLDSPLFFSEEKAIEEARKVAAEKQTPLCE
jgi:GntR family transcriptional regulator, hexuronate regulon transcriptional repressor